MGINQIGYDIGNVGEGSITDDPNDVDETGLRLAPWLQDVDDDPDNSAAFSVWANWKINYRDVLILNGALEPVHVRNLSNVGLQDPANYCDLATIMLAVEDENLTAEEIDQLDLDGECPEGITPPS